MYPAMHFSVSCCTDCCLQLTKLSESVQSSLKAHPAAKAKTEEAPAASNPDATDDDRDVADAVEGEGTSADAPSDFAAAGAEDADNDAAHSNDGLAADLLNGADEISGNAVGSGVASGEFTGDDPLNADSEASAGAKPEGGGAERQEEEGVDDEAQTLAKGDGAEWEGKEGADDEAQGTENREERDATNADLLENDDMDRA